MCCLLGCYVQTGFIFWKKEKFTEGGGHYYDGSSGSGHSGYRRLWRRQSGPATKEKEESFVCSALSVVILMTTSENYEQDF